MAVFLVRLQSWGWGSFPPFQVTTFAWQPGSQYGVAATRGADNALASDCRGQFGRPSTRMGCRICVTVRSDHAENNVLASKCEYPPFRCPLLNVPYYCAPKCLGDWFSTTTGAGVSGRSTGKIQLVIIFLENARKFHEIFTSGGGKFW